MPFRRLNVKDVAQYLHMGEEEIEQLVHNKEIPFERVGGRPVFIRKEVDAWASQRILRPPDKRAASGKRSGGSDGLKDQPIISDRLREEFIQPELAARTRPSVLNAMAALAEGTGLVYQPEELLASLRAREELCSTAMSGGFALLHPRHHEPHMFGESFLLLARTPHPIPFGALDGHSTDIFFLICCQDDRMHLNILTRLVILCSESGVIASVRAATDREAMRRVLVEAEQKVLRRTQ